MVEKGVPVRGDRLDTPSLCFFRGGLLTSRSKSAILSIVACLAFADPIRSALPEGTVPPETLDVPPETVDGGRAFPPYQEAVRRQMLREFACGPLSLLKVFDSLGVEISDQESRQITDAAGTTGTNMLQLKRLAEQQGVYSVGVELSASELARLG